MLTPRWRKHYKLSPAYLLLIAWTAFSVTGLSYVILGSFKTQRELIRRPWNLPGEFRLDNFEHAWGVARLSAYFVNSVFVVTAAIIIVLCLSAPAAYVLTRGNFRFRHNLTTYFIIGIGIPIPLLYIPLFTLLTSLGLADTLFGLIIVFVATSIPFTVYLLTGFFSGIPSDIRDAAIVDGCTDWQLFLRVMLPLCRTGLIAACIFNTIWLWNEYQLTLVLITEQDNKTLPLGLFALQNSTQYSGNWTQFYAGVTIVVIPMVVAFILLSERIIAGMTAGAVK